MRNLRIHGDCLSQDTAFKALYNVLEDYARNNRGFSIDDVIEHLHANNIFGNDSEETTDAKRLLVFSILGWQSMIYQPDFNVCPSNQLVIHHEVGDPDSGLVYDTYTVPAEMSDRPLYVLLKGFGNLLPARSSNTAMAAVESSKAAASWTALYPDELNAYLLHTLLRVRFRWVDTLALHLDYDKSSRTLSLFSFPSMCISQLGTHSGTIFAFASTEVNAADPRADEADIAHFLQEVLLSFRLLFGQSVKSRKLFRYIFDPAEVPFPQSDTLLSHLCSEKLPIAGAEGVGWMPRDKHVYYAARDFPVLYERVELLAKELNGARPTSMKDLLRDRRDTLQFWTFWLVSIIGGVSISLSMIQVILQAIQIAQAAGKI